MTTKSTPKPLSTHLSCLTILPIGLFGIIATLLTYSLHIHEQHYLQTQLAARINQQLKNEIAEHTNNNTRSLPDFLQQFKHRNNLSLLKIHFPPFHQAEKLTTQPHSSTYFFSTQLSLPKNIKKQLALNDPDIVANPSSLIRIEFSLKPHQPSFTPASILIIGFGITLGFILLTILFTLRFKHTLLAPLHIFRLTFHSASQNQLKQINVDSGISEFNQLNDAYNLMIESIRSSHNHLIDCINKAIDELSEAALAVEEKNQHMEETTRNAIKQNNYKSEFLAHMSHEIRTPMNGIIGFSDLLINSPLSPHQKEQVFLIKTSGMNLLSIVNQILDYYSLEHGQFATETTTFNIRECIEETVCSIIPPSDKTRVIMDISPTFPDTLNADPVRIRQILLNLLSNACKYTSEGEVVLRAALTPQSELFVSITDQGTGIPEEALADLFRPFNQTVDYEIHKQPSTGLGLSITHQIIQHLDGKIGVNSQPDTGTVFWFKIPVTHPHNANINSTCTTITLIDTCKRRSKGLKRQIKHLGHTCRSFATIDDVMKSPQTGNILFIAEPYPLLFDKHFQHTLQRLKQATQAERIIFLMHPKHHAPHIETLTIPCRSQQLQQLLTHKTALIPAEPIDKNAPHYAAHVLVAEDNEINQNLIIKQLTPLTDNITLAKNGKEALDLLNQTQYDLVLMDLQMPYYGGEELIKMIKKNGHLNAQTPVIATTANAQPQKQKQLINDGFDQCLIKPIVKDQLNEVLALWCQPCQSEANAQEFAIRMLKKTLQDKTLARSLLQKLFNELPQQITQINANLKTRDYTTALEITHRLHGSVRFCGFIQLSTLAEKLENNLSTHSFQTLPADFSELQQGVEHFVKIHKEILSHI